VLGEAGGAVLDLRGEPLRYNARESLINPDFVAIGDPEADWSALFGGP
jgi:3'(2'), 5'-bisphosphate nucleotidase